MVKYQEGKLGKLRVALMKSRAVNENNDYKFLIKKYEVYSLVHIL